MRLTWPEPQPSLLFVNQLPCFNWLPSDMADGEKKALSGECNLKGLCFVKAIMIIHIY